MAKRITCRRCPANLGPQARKPYTRGGAYVLNERDVIKHLCTETSLDECWIWRWGRSNGYAQVRHNGKNELVGPILLGILDSDLIQIHACDNPPCVNPAHLRAGTDAENTADRDKRMRGNQPKGSKQGSAKLTESDIPAIRACLTAGETCASISRRYGVHKSAISLIKFGKTWKHVP